MHSVFDYDAFTRGKLLVGERIEGDCDYCKDWDNPNRALSILETPPVPGGPYVVFICESCEVSQEVA